MEEIVAVQVQGEFRVSTRDLSARMGNAHKNVMSLIRDYEAEFKGFGRVAFETRPFETAGGTQQGTIAMLNEEQSYLLLTLVRNSDTTVPLKAALIRAFTQARRQLAVVAPPTPAQQMLMHAQVLVEQEARINTLERRLDNTPIAHHPNEEAVIHELCQELGRVIPGGYPVAYRAFKAHFGTAGVPLAKYSSLPVSRFDEGCGYLRGLIAQHSTGRLLEQGA